MTPITSPAEIKTYLLSILTADLGKWADGTPALWIGQPPAHLAPATGPQLILSPIAQGKSTTSGSAKFLDQYYDITIVNLASTLNGPSLAEVGRILQHSTHIRSVVWMPRSANTAEQITAKFYSPGFVPAI